MSIRSVNPATGDVVAEFEPLGDGAIDGALETAASAFRVHRRSSFEARRGGLLRVAERLDDDRERWSRLLTEEMGKTITSARAEVEKCAWVCRYYAEQAEKLVADVAMESDAGRSFTTYLPLGPILAVMPWNFPFWQVFRFAAPAVMAGNVVLLKHASNVPRAALALHEIFAAADFGAKVFQTLLVESAVIPRVLEDRRVVAATVTGSVRAGASVAASAGKCAKKTVLELGGSDAFIVMPSADLAGAVEVAVQSRTLNNGQSCIAAKRFIVHRDVYDDFVANVVARFESLVVGDPLDDGTDVGPLAMARTRDKLVEQVEAFVAAGASRVTGAHPREGRGHYFSPGVLVDVSADSAAYHEEVFGPVALLFRADDLDAAIGIANDSRYGLGSSIWTRDEDEATRAIREIEAGATFVNSLVRSDPRLPFGGVKSSGYGRELARQGILEFMNCKTVAID
jgi:succinate-semialdehyde dehydrogenase / glutarate-semialdehyde dehydrogenase